MNLLALSAVLVFSLIIVLKDHKILKNYRPINRVISYVIIGLSIGIWIYTLSPFPIIHPAYLISQWMYPYIPVPSE